MKAPPPEIYRALVDAALDEDLGSEGHDLTSDALFDETTRCRGRIVARQKLVLCGLPMAREVFLRIDGRTSFDADAEEGAGIEAGSVVARVGGTARAVLRGERAALNFVMRLSGIATATAQALAELRGTDTRLLDTRKTLPGWRRLDKYAVACGGGTNHRMGLYDAVMIKDTHLGVVGSIEAAVAAALGQGHAPETVTVEVRDVEQLRRAIRAGAGRALLDNMDPPQLRRAVAAARGRIVLEASGGLRPGRLREVAASGIDCISMGWLTHSAPAADLAMEIAIGNGDGS